MKKILSLVITVVIIALGATLFQPQVLDLYTSLKRYITDQKLAQEIQKVEKVITPPPLRSTTSQKGAILTRSGVIQWTNAQRQKNGLPPLAENFKLNNSARVKVQDMFAKQYFEHVSPSGVAVGDLAKQVGYQFIVIGENLALGNFKSDQDLVQAWMDSPGHRANILNTRYRDIGVAVAKGRFEGHDVWLAVQHFGLALDTCPQIDPALKSSLDTQQKELDALHVRLDIVKAELESMKKNDRQAYNQKVDEYNQLAKEYNQLLDIIKAKIAAYNQQVNTFNTCVNG